MDVQISKDESFHRTFNNGLISFEGALSKMQRWFFLEDEENARRRAGTDKDLEDKQIGSDLELGDRPPRKWFFRVRVEDLQPGEVVCVTGNDPALGSWHPENVLVLEQEADPEVWSKEAYISNKPVEYRYCVCLVIEHGIQVMVRHWETHIKPRYIATETKCPLARHDPETYGNVMNYKKIDKGWLIKETAIHLVFSDNPLTIWRPRFVNRKIYLKVTPINLLKHANFPKTMAEALEESLSEDTQETLELPKHTFTEVASIKSEDSSFHRQEQFGAPLEEQDVLIFQNFVQFPATTAFLIDLYIYSSRAVEGEPPYHAGFTYILPSALSSSEGILTVPVTTTKHRPLGEMNLRYVVIKPMSTFKCDMSITFTRYWNKTRSGLDVGHRGAGSSFKLEVKKCAEIRENTIASMKTAIEYGADLVEFDVQLSKDLVPIIYHDFHVCIAMKRKKQLDDIDMLQIPLKDLTLEQLRLLKVYHLTEGKSKNQKFFDEELEEHQPFPTLQHVLEVLNPHVGFNIEIKWNTQLLDGSYELYHPYDMNLYLDRILEVVLQYGGTRRIIFSCFNPDTCSALRMKQNKYPVLFLTQGETTRYPPYKDPRCWSILPAIKFANMIEILGLSVHTEDLLRDNSLIKTVKDAHLALFCWGEDNDNPDNIKFLKDLGVQGIIYDNIKEHSSNVKESIFLVEARESQKDLIRLAAMQSEVSTPPQQQPFTERKIDIDIAREGLGMLSTATSLESLESCLSDYKDTKNKQN